MQCISFSCICKTLKTFPHEEYLVFFILFLPLAAITIWHWCLIVFWNTLWFSAMFWCLLESVIPGLSSGGGCRRAHAAVTECCSRWVFQQSSSSCYLPPTWCSILTVPAVNWGLPLTIFIHSLSPFCICAVGRLLFCFQNRFISQLCFLFSCVLLCRCFSWFFPPHFISAAVEEEAVPFVWLYVSCQLNLLPI